nr:hypothetical protein CFP56_69493 [Quercus suber]
MSTTEWSKVVSSAVTCFRYCIYMRRSFEIVTICYTTLKRAERRMSVLADGRGRLQVYCIYCSIVVASRRFQDWSMTVIYRFPRRQYTVEAVAYDDIHRAPRSAKNLSLWLSAFRSSRTDGLPSATGMPSPRREANFFVVGIRSLREDRETVTVLASGGERKLRAHAIITIMTAAPLAIASTARTVRYIFSALSATVSYLIWADKCGHISSSSSSASCSLSETIHGHRRYRDTVPYVADAADRVNQRTTVTKLLSQP